MTILPSLARPLVQLIPKALTLALLLIPLKGPILAFPHVLLLRSLTLNVSPQDRGHVQDRKTTYFRRTSLGPLLELLDS